jgi:hypothetical protein
MNSKRYRPISRLSLQNELTQAACATVRTVAQLFSPVQAQNHLISDRPQTGAAPSLAGQTAG